MPLYKATKIVLVLKKGGKNPIPCLFIIEGKISQQLDKSKFGLLCKATINITIFKFTPLKTPCSLPLY